jgi:Uma2 family endonuclease
MERAMVSQPVQYLTPQEYLALERAAETKSEYIDGMLVAMAGATKEHGIITLNFASEIHQQLKSRPCIAFTQDMRVRIVEGGMYSYPDVVVVCEPPQFEDDEFDVLLNPTMIVEVLSQSTEAYDRGLKFRRYRRRPSLQEYVLVAQDRAVVERYSRHGDHWVLTEVTGLDASIDLPSIGCTLALRDIYDKVEGLLEDPLQDPRVTT